MTLKLTNTKKQGELSAQELNEILGNLKKDVDWPSIFILAVWATDRPPIIEALVYEERDGSKMTYEVTRRGKNLERAAKQRDRKATAAGCLQVTGDFVERHKWSKFAA